MAQDDSRDQEQGGNREKDDVPEPTGPEGNDRTRRPRPDLDEFRDRLDGSNRGE